eukprot:5959146-Pleurochrysis_carterae.AAC.2
MLRFLATYHGAFTGHTSQARLGLVRCRLRGGDGRFAVDERADVLAVGQVAQARLGEAERAPHAVLDDQLEAASKR